VGGYFQPQCTPGVSSYGYASWWDIRYYVNPEATPATPTTWGRLKTLYR
jgi:hypothetical protein